MNLLQTMIRRNCKTLTDPLVSVVVPTFNRAEFLPRAVISVLNQSVEDIELVISDDGSTDHTETYIRQIMTRDNRVVYIPGQHNHGAQEARNKGIKAAKGKWIAFLDSDDEWLPTMLDAGLILHKETGCSVVHSQGFWIDENNPENPKICLPELSGMAYKKLLCHPGPMFQGLLVKRECLEQIGLLDESFVSYQEWDTFIRLSKHFELAFVSEPVFNYFIHSDNTISIDQKRDADGWAQVVEKHKTEIIKNCGVEMLIKHYKIIAKKYDSIGSNDISEKYKRKYEKISRN